MTTTRKSAMMACTGLLGFAAASSGSGPAPDTVQLYGVARDFLKSHPDFEVTPATGLGHYAGNIALTLGAGYVPTFVGNGFKVATEWRNSAGKPIAPHLYQVSGVPGQISLANTPTVQNN